MTTAKQKAKAEALVEAYIKSKSRAWSETTLYKQRALLLSLPAERLLPVPSQDPQALYEHLLIERGMAPYSIKTVFVRVTDYFEWLVMEGEMTAANPYRKFMRAEANLFKNAYTAKLPKMSFKEAIARIGRIEDKDSRAKAMQLILSGMRLSESMTLTSEGVIVGKGNKGRQVEVPSGFESLDYGKHKVTFYRHLKAVGLKPHDLRKLFATQLAERGLHPGELMAAMGWSSIAPAVAYLGAHRKNEAIKAMHAQYAPSKKETESNAVKVPKPVQGTKRARPR